MNWNVRVNEITWGFLVKPPAQGPSKDYLVIEADYLPLDLIQFVDVATECSQPLRHVVFFTFGYNLSSKDWQMIEHEFGRSRPLASFIFVEDGEHRNVAASTASSHQTAAVAAAVAAAHNSGTLDDPGTVTVRLANTVVLVEPPVDMMMLGVYVVTPPDET